MVLEAVGGYQVTKGGGVDREEKGSKNRALGDPHRKGQWRGGDRVVGDTEGAL